MDERGGGDMTTEAEVEGGHKSRDADSHQKLEESRHRLSCGVVDFCPAKLILNFQP